MKSKITKVIAIAISVFSIGMLTSTAVFADGGSNPYQPHVPVDTAFTGSEYLFLAAVAFIALGTVIISYGRYVKNQMV